MRIGERLPVGLGVALVQVEDLLPPKRVVQLGLGD
jgi:hypothetical protein